MSNIIHCNTTTDDPYPGHTTNRIRGAARLELVKRGLSAGKSRRQIARELGYDEGTVRRDIKVLALSPDQLAAIQNGDTAEKFLNQERLRKTGKDRSAATKCQRRTATDKGSGVYSNPLAKSIVDWLTSQHPTTDNQILVLNTLKLPKNIRPDHKGTPKPGLTKVLARGNRRGTVEGLLDNINRCAQLLNDALFLVEPIQAIRTAAVEKALNAIRSGDHWPPYPDQWKAEYENIKRRRDYKNEFGLG